MIKYIFSCLITLTAVIHLNAQNFYFPTNGTITYERKFHLKNFLKRTYSNTNTLNIWDKATVEFLMKDGPTEVITNHTLKFADQETLFETVKEDYPAIYQRAFDMLPVLHLSKTYINLGKGLFSKLIDAEGEELILADSLPKVKWKYTDEYRNIAGYDCRRANGIVQDSIYVVAFFTNQIAIAAGPELIQGLPGTILGVSLPSMNINMFATSVQLSNDQISSSLTKNRKVVVQNKEEIVKSLKNSVYRWMNDKDFQKQLGKVFF